MERRSPISPLKCLVQVMIKFFGLNKPDGNKNKRIHILRLFVHTKEPTPQEGRDQSSTLRKLY